MASNSTPTVPRRLSSHLTFPSKFVVPTALIAFSATAFIFVPSHFSAAVGIVPVVLMVGSIFIAAIALSLLVIPLKRVRMDADWLYISNYRKEIVVPLSNVAEVTECPTGTIFTYHVRITFLSMTAFGSKVLFSPVESGWTGAHQVVREIRAAAARATRRERP
jgi:hypothetical protein